MNQISYGKKKYTDESLGDFDCFIGDALTSESLSVDTLSATVVDYSTRPDLLASGGRLVSAGGLLLITKDSETRLDQMFSYGDPLYYYHDDRLIGKFHTESIKRIGKYSYRLNGISSVGLLLTSEHYGGIYNGQTAAEVMSEIVGGVITYTLDAELGKTPIYGLLRKASRRDNLRNLLFAIGGQIRKDALGQLNVVPMKEEASYRITADEFYMGGSVTGLNPASGVAVVEHSFMKLPSDKVVTLYDGESASEPMISPKGAALNGVLVEFREPMHDLEIRNAQILESNANYAVISGSPAATLTGKQYTHTERIISRNRTTNGAPNIITSNSCELVNLFNAELVADRLMAYYGAGRTIDADIVMGGQKPGDTVTFTDPFGDESKGFISEMELTMSAIIKAKTKIITGFTPTASGNFYSNVVRITESGTFTIPLDCKGKIRVVLIGGGDGGESGKPGEDGDMGPMGGTGIGKSGAGGPGGKGGAPGKVLVATMTVSKGQVFSVEIGIGGVGADPGELPGTGRPSKFGSLNSEDGFSPENGYSSLLSQEICAIPGTNGIDGGHGQTDSERPTVKFGDSEWIAGLKGGSLQNGQYTAVGGYGGGAAVGSNGESGKNGSISSQPFADGGAGGNGANAVIPGKNGTTPGSGGFGGHGGGGGGGGGGATGASDGHGSYYYWPGSGGKAGNGSKGGDGANGIVYVYY